MKPDDLADRRSVPRSRHVGLAAIVVARKSHPGRFVFVVEELSATGARSRGGMPLPVGERVKLIVTASPEHSNGERG